MAFNVLQKNIIRESLKSYRASNGVSEADPLPMSHLTERLKEFATPDTGRITMETLWNVKDEALRRFVVGPKNYLGDEQLRMIADFLIDEGHLIEEALAFKPGIPFDPAVHPQRTWARWILIRSFAVKRGRVCPHCAGMLTHEHASGA
jgi:hypothetical protein